MHIAIARSDFEAAVDSTAVSLGTTGSDINTHFLFRVVGDAGQEKVEVLTYSNRLFSAAPLRAAELVNTDHGTMFTIEGKRLLKWLTAAPQDSKFDIRFDGSIVEIETNKGSMDFQSLDPGKFPFWDKRMQAVKAVSTVTAGRLSAALAYARSFNADEKATSSPELSVSEVQGGRLFASDKKSVTTVKVGGLEQSTLRVHYNDCGSITRFLDAVKDDTVEVLESDVTLAFRRKDGAYLGCGRFRSQFPAIGRIPEEKDKDVLLWELPKEDLKGAIAFLIAGADENDARIRFKRPDPAGPVQVSMVAMSGREKVQTLAVLNTRHEKDDQPIQLPDHGFILPHSHLQRVLSAWRGPSVGFGINLKGASGFSRFVEERDGDMAQTILVWIRAV